MPSCLCLNGEASCTWSPPWFSITRCQDGRRLRCQGSNVDIHHEQPSVHPRHAGFHALSVLLSPRPSLPNQSTCRLQLDVGVDHSLVLVGVDYSLAAWFEHFVHRGLFDYMKARHLQPLSLNSTDNNKINIWVILIMNVETMNLISVFLAVSFEALKVMGVIHADLKGDNIMFVNQRDKPLKVKLIDFGLAVPISEVELGDTLQALPYRAPEVVLGLPISEAIDIWSLGCVIASMFLGAHLYPSCRDEYELLTCIMDTHGLPSERMLEYGVKSHWYFTKDQGSLNNGWRLKIIGPVQDCHNTSVVGPGCATNAHLAPPQSWVGSWVYTGFPPRKTPEEFYDGPAIEKDRDPGRSLVDFMDFLPSLYPEEDEEVLVEFVELLKGMLEVDPHRRMNPSNIL
ncbi:Homeodomain-interacting protein kinase 3 [Merluccius polli]|uniref:Homeodomain-interacting protein kinase 3 n=1 Tax=Merluccius polli TaxID=89951 RepID=A0AA47N6R6_MERPO|nr:Homeodomain-interacting protein kinase 3 [Merluccius polli]